VLLEAPGSLTMEVQDVPALAAIARNRGLVSLMDNTWASPLGFPVLERGVDIAIMSLTKHVGGHSDLMMGSATAGPSSTPSCGAPHRARSGCLTGRRRLALRGLRTLGIRLEREPQARLR
jgi:cystathionine beta-lyase